MIASVTVVYILVRCGKPEVDVLTVCVPMHSLVPSLPILQSQILIRYGTSLVIDIFKAIQVLSASKFITHKRSLLSSIEFLATEECRLMAPGNRAAVKVIRGKPFAVSSE
jgi:hypothetical protein